MSTGPASTPPLEDLQEVRRLLRELRGRWRLRVVLGTLLGTVAVAAGGLAVLVLVDHLVGGGVPGAGPVLRWIPLGLAAVVLARGGLRLARPPSDRELALQAETQDPSLDHLLLTSMAGGEAGALRAAFVSRVRTRLAGVRAAGLSPLGLRSPAGWSAGVLTVALVLLVTTPGGPSALWARWGAGAGGGGGAGAAGPFAAAGGESAAGLSLSRSLEVQVTPPAYTGLPAAPAAADEPLALLPGSRVGVHGPGAAPTAMVVGGNPVDVEPEDGGWALSWRVAPGEKGLLLQRPPAPGAEPDEHLLVVEPVADQPPVVELDEPAGDLVVAAGEGDLPLRATAEDDHGVADLRLTWLRTRGGGESFAFDEGELPWDVTERAPDGVVRGGLLLPLETLDLQPGDVVHFRAVARDRNDVTGPGEGVSSTRILRVALPEEAHLVTSLVGLPLEVERDPILSQRMILLLTERLLADMDRGLPEDSVLPRSVAIANEQRRLREQVGEQVYVRATGAMQEPNLHLGMQDVEEDPAAARADERFRSLPPALLPDSMAELLRERERRELRTHGGIPDDPSVRGGRSGAPVLSETGPEGHAHDASPILSVNNELLRVHDWMWEAERFLLQGEPAGSIPPQELALAELQRLREAERVFARGRTTVAPVDVAAVRGTGKTDGVEPGRREAGDPLPSVAARAGALEVLAGELDGLPTADALRRLREQALLLMEDPGIPASVPSLLSRAASAVREGRVEDARGLVLEARGALAPGGTGGATGPATPSASPVEGGYLQRIRTPGGP